MTDTQTTGGIHPSRPLPGRRPRLISRLLSSIRYDALLVPSGVLTMADAVMRDGDKAYDRWSKPARLQQQERRPGIAAVFGHGLMSSILGLLSWFLGMLWVMAVVRGPFFGFVEDGPFEPGTWGGPTKAGAWAVHVAVAVPIILALPFVLRGIALLHVAVIRRLYGLRAGWWVLPATIAACAGGMLFVWAWIEQL